MKNCLLILFLGIAFSTFGQNEQSVKKVDWNGYTQLRVSSNFEDNTTLMLRRLKFWLHSTPEFSPHWSYKVQVLFTSWMQEKFFLQDVKIGYKKGLFSVDLGQFVPKYSLQRFQPDYKIAAIERAFVINALIPNGTLGVRDIGAQLNFHTKNKFIETSLGVFNGYGIMEYRFNSRGYLLTHRTAFNIPLAKNKLQFGYSLQFREAENMHLKHLLPDSVLFTGQDFRYNIFALYKTKHWALQVEYLTADLSGEKAQGFYVLSTINLKKSQLVLGVEQYEDLIAETNNQPHYRLGYNYLINKDKIKLFLDNYFQIIDGSMENYYASIQLQLFFN
jgi:hypothetical protein